MNTVLHVKLVLYIIFTTIYAYGFYRAVMFQDKTWAILCAFLFATTVSGNSFSDTSLLHGFLTGLLGDRK